MRPGSEEGVIETVKEETSAPDKLTKDKVHVEELRLPEIMIPVTKTTGKKTPVFPGLDHSKLIIFLYDVPFGATAV